MNIAPLASRSSRLNGSQKNELKVLIIDDDRKFTRLVKFALEARTSFEVRVENDPTVSLDAAYQFLPDIVIIEVVMPGMDGGDVLAQFHADPIFSETPVIMLTGIVLPEEVDENQGCIGGQFFMAKPVTVEELGRAIEFHARRQ